MDKTYDSEFTQFMNSFLKQHPEVASDQMYRWHLEWDPKEISSEPREEETERVP